MINHTKLVSCTVTVLISMLNAASVKRLAESVWADIIGTSAMINVAQDNSYISAIMCGEETLGSALNFNMHHIKMSTDLSSFDLNAIQSMCTSHTLK